jgi:hypothetical protein
VRDSTRSLLDALMGFVAGVPTAPGFDLPGLTGFARPGGPWDVVTSARAPDLPGDTFSFVALEDGTLVVDEDVPEGSATPLADAVEGELRRPYEAVAVRRGDDDGLWRVAAVDVLVAAAAPDDPSDRVDLARVAGDVSATVDGEEADPDRAPRGLLDLLAHLDGDAALTAERLDETTWVAQRWEL